LSAININKFVNNGIMFWEKLYDTAYDVMGLMDNIIDVMEFPDERFMDNALKYRHVGIGPMGLADAMFSLDIKYDSVKGKQFAAKVMETITTACVHKSAELARDKGKFFEYDDVRKDVEEIIFSFVEDEEVRELVRMYGVRNVQHTTCAPTGTVALSCDASYGIEPSFGLIFQKNLVNGSTMFVVNPIFKERFENEEWYTEDFVERVFNNGGTLKNIRGVPKEVREVFVTAHDIKPKDRIDIQASIQKHCSTAISSTINLPETSTKEDVSEIYKYAYKSNLKGITVYRDGCKDNQPVSFKPVDDNQIHQEFDRPSRLSADVYKLDTGRGTMYVTVGTSDGRPVELFVQLGKGGQYLNTLTESIGRVISIALQHGVPIDQIVKTLIGINSDNPSWCRLSDTDDKPAQILSVPDGLAKLLDRFYSNNDYKEFKGETCPQCSKPMRAIEGCWNCTFCGYSKCS
jgi:ribonucleoside-diphosphate reductase alpha chain